MKSKIDNIIKNCFNCECSKLEINDNNKSEFGFGKLFGSEGKKNNEIMIVGMNPSYRRFPKSSGNAFGSGESVSKYDKVGIKFANLLNEFGILDSCYITNAVKCSTSDNKITNKILKNCFENFKLELEYCKPKLIIALGNQVYDFLRMQEIENLEKLRHPSYYFSYHRDTIENYKNSIRDILKKYKL